MAECAKCNKKTNRSQDAINCSNKSCGRVFHPDCVTIPPDISASVWLCQFCQNPQQGGSEGRITQTSMDDLKRSLEFFRTEMTKKMDSVIESQSFLSEKYDEAGQHW